MAGTLPAGLWKTRQLWKTLGGTRTNPFRPEHWTNRPGTGESATRRLGSAEPVSVVRGQALVQVDPFRVNAGGLAKLPE